MSGRRGLEDVVAAEAAVPAGEDASQGDLLDPAPQGAAAGEVSEVVARTGKAGRPRGARNRSTSEMVRYLNTFGQGPLVGLAKIVNMIDEATGLPDFGAIAKLCGIDRGEAAEFWLKCARELGPYMHQKLPIAVSLKAEHDLDVLIVNTGKTLDDAAQDPQDLLGGAFGGVIDAEFEDVEPEDESEENQ